MPKKKKKYEATKTGFRNSRICSKQSVRWSFFPFHSLYGMCTMQYVYDCVRNVYGFFFLSYNSVLFPSCVFFPFIVNETTNE